MKKRSLALLMGLVIGALYYGFCCVYFFGGTMEAAQEADTAVFAGTALASALVTPHIALGWIAVVLNLTAFLANSRGCALATLILYSVSAVLFFMYAVFVVPEIILSIIGYVRLKRINQKNQAMEVRKTEKKRMEGKG